MSALIRNGKKVIDMVLSKTSFIRAQLFPLPEMGRGVAVITI